VASESIALEAESGLLATFCSALGFAAGWKKLKCKEKHTNSTFRFNLELPLLSFSRFAAGSETSDSVSELSARARFPALQIIEPITKGQIRKSIMTFVV
jgi:hypothetical protein